jgi:hypothetical protein
VYTGFWWGNLRERDFLEDLSIDGKIILKWFFKRWDGGMDWNYLAQHKCRWQAPANALMNFLFPCNADNFSTG